MPRRLLLTNNPQTVQKGISSSSTYAAHRAPCKRAGALVCGLTFTFGQLVCEQVRHVFSGHSGAARRDIKAEGGSCAAPATEQVLRCKARRERRQNRLILPGYIANATGLRSMCIMLLHHLNTSGLLALLMTSSVLAFLGNVLRSEWRSLKHRLVRTRLGANF